MFHKEVDAVLLGLDGVFLRRYLHDLDARNIEFEAAGRALVGPHGACDPARAFERKLLRRCECGLVDILLEHHTLNHAAAIAQADENQLAFLGLAGHPTSQCDLLAVVVRNTGNHCRGKL